MGASSLAIEVDPPPIDRHWNWDDVEIQWEGNILKSEKVAVVTGDGYIQGAMLISSEGVKSELSPENECLFVELLFTAPQNRAPLRADNKKYFGGVGPELLRWGVLFSRELGYDGRLRLDASPDYLSWYQTLGFEKLNIDPMEYEGVQYTPMELPSIKAQSLIDRIKDASGKKGAKK